MEIDDNTYITSCQWFISRDLHTLYYREYETWCKYTQPPNQSRRCIEFLTDTKSKYQRPSCSQVCRISLTNSTPTYLRIEATGMDFRPEPSGPPIDSAEEKGTLDLKL